MRLRAEPTVPPAAEPRMSRARGRSATAARANAIPNILVTIPISHYCEKARWALDRAGIGYHERAHLQLIHRVAARRAGGGTTVPVLVCADGVLAQSAEILAFADARAPAESRLYPADATGAAEVRALERDFDERLGPHGRRWMYYRLRGRRDLAIAYGCTGVPNWERRLLPLLYPLVTRGIDRFLDITPATVQQSEAEVRAVFDAVDERLSDGRRYLCGDRFTAADLTFSALAAAVLMPPGYGVPLPQPDELPTPAAALVLELREHLAGAHALAMFRDERRREPAEICSTTARS
jgi:glutathione S-transferase